MKSKRPDITLLPPDVERDAPYAHAWFMRPEGRATLLSMGNVESAIQKSTLAGEQRIMQEFIDLERDGKQITRAIITGGKTIGVVWIELVENHGVTPPGLHIMIGDPDYRGKGIGRAVMESALDYIRDVLHHDVVYTRHLVRNLPVAKLNASLGFQADGDPYTDEDGLEWQNIKKVLS